MSIFLDLPLHHNMLSSLQMKLELSKYNDIELRNQLTVLFHLLLLLFDLFKITQ